MASSDIRTIHLRNELALNIATLLQEPVGSTRTVDIDYDALLLDDDLVARNVDARVRLTRLGRYVLADGEVRADVTLECVRCLTEFVQAVETAFSEQFRQIHDVRGGDLPDQRELERDDSDDEINEDAFSIDENHELNLAEALRQNLVLAIPMTPVCGDDCPGPPEREQDDEPEQRRGQFDALAELLDDDSDNASRG